jgi:hypothetical protein
MNWGVVEGNICAHLKILSLNLQGLAKAVHEKRQKSRSTDQDLNKGFFYNLLYVSGGKVP